jgi:Nuclear pore protein 84 / 107
MCTLSLHASIVKYLHVLVTRQSDTIYIAASCIATDMYTPALTPSCTTTAACHCCLTLHLSTHRRVVHDTITQVPSYPPVAGAAISDGDHVKLSALEWLSFEESHKLEGIQQANALIRQFVLQPYDTAAGSADSTATAPR